MTLARSRPVPELKTQIRKLDHEASDLRFLNNQYVHKVRCLEKDSKSKSERIQQLQEKNLQAVVQTPGSSTAWSTAARSHILVDRLKLFCYSVFN